MPDYPGPWEALLMGLAAYRIWRLLAEDDILDRPRRWVLRLGKDWKKEGDPVPEGYREKWGLFLTCPWCAGFWISFLVIWATWLAFEDWVTALCVPWALSAFVGLVRTNLDPPEE